MFYIGDWVLYLNQTSALYRAVGFITNYGIGDEGYYVCFTRDSQ